MKQVISQGLWFSKRVVWGCNHMFWPPWLQSLALFLWADVCLSVCGPSLSPLLWCRLTHLNNCRVFCVHIQYESWWFPLFVSNATMRFTFVVFGEISHDMTFCLVIRNLEVIVVLDTTRTLSLTTHQIQQPGQKSSVLSYHLKPSSGAGV